ncbi:hypothetical protein GOBAR_AA12690 [Gossypium barbadense]|uniref:Tr-type G domain-containing protein n=1 Tax=Gossypium barbadense TaxID=3634 RepID=A0A2P5XX77_GOSBA|nr:hypothetical protein GOBAR_AA12690 [Gossypium barbadense]
MARFPRSAIPRLLYTFFSSKTRRFYPSPTAALLLGNFEINIIDTPGHVDFTIEVERALRVLDGAILVLCSVGGVQSQSITVDRQMRRYEVPRLAFINKLDRMGSDPWKVLNQARSKLRHHSAAVQVPIGLEENFQGLIDLVQLKAYYFHGSSGEKVVAEEIPADMDVIVAEKRRELIEMVSEVDDKLAEAFLNDDPISSVDLEEAVCRATIARKFVPVFMGSAFKNKGVQPLLDGVLSYLPCPIEVSNYALDQTKNEEKVMLPGTPDGPLVALAFKLEEGRFGQLTYLRVYEGVIRKGDFIVNINTGKKIKVPRLVRMHSDEMEDIQEAHAGQIVAVFGVDCASFSKALNRFQREDPTFRVGLDAESGQTIISGMGELHLDIYVERIRREYKVDAIVGKPRVNFRETITQHAEFDYLHKKQSGGQGQYGRVCGKGFQRITITFGIVFPGDTFTNGSVKYTMTSMSVPEPVMSLAVQPVSKDSGGQYVEPLPPGSPIKFEFENMIVGQAVPSNFIPAIEKGFKEAANSGSLIGHPVENIRIVLTDGASHAVDSSELAFKLAAIYAFRQCYSAARPVILEPIMLVELKVPTEFQGTVAGDINRKGVIVGNDQDGDDSIITANVPLKNMFGYSTMLRSMTQGKGEFTMEYKEHSPVSQDVQMQLVSTHKADKAE